MQVIDLSMPIDVGHFRWPVERGRKGDFAEGDAFEASWLRTSCHSFTHVDAPSHMVPDGATLDDLDLSRVVGTAAVIDLSDVAPEEEIDSVRLAARAVHLRAGGIALFRTCWDEQRDWRSEHYWRDAPWLSRDACEWLLQRGITAAAFDFPQDWTIRLALDGDIRPIEEHVSHDVLLRNQVTLIEYLVGTRALRSEHTFLCAQPLRFVGADGAPARVIALDDL